VAIDAESSTQHVDGSAPPSRAAEVLDELVRGRTGSAAGSGPVGRGRGRRRSWQLRQLGPDAPHRSDADRQHADPDSGPTRRSPGPAVLDALTERTGRGVEWIGRVDLRRWASVLGLALVVLAVAAAVFVRRPPPIEERLPMADSGGVTSDAASEPTGAGSPPTSASDSTSESAAGRGDGTEGSERLPEQLVVHVAGAVTAPGVVRLSAASRVVDAVTAAGGMRADADPDRVNLAAPLVDGQRVVVPVIGQPPPAEISPSGPVSAGGAAGAAGGPPVAPGSPAGLVDLNTATAEQLDTLPGVGPATASAILDHRESSGPFDSVEDLLDVRGIGEAKLDALRDLVSIGSGW